jgi:hypothetical protein
VANYKDISAIAKMEEEEAEDYAHETELKLPVASKLAVFLMDLLYSLLLRPDGSLNRGLSNFFDRVLSVKPTTSSGDVLCQDFIIDDARGLGFRIYTPRTAPGQAGQVFVWG